MDYGAVCLPEAGNMARFVGATATQIGTHYGGGALEYISKRYSHFGGRAHAQVQIQYCTVELPFSFKKFTCRSTLSLLYGYDTAMAPRSTVRYRRKVASRKIACLEKVDHGKGKGNESVCLLNWSVLLFENRKFGSCETS
jgi:hypothetical protein